MGCYAVAAMLEEPPSVACRHLVESSAHRLYEAVTRMAGTRSSNECRVGPFSNRLSGELEGENVAGSATIGRRHCSRKRRYAMADLPDEANPTTGSVSYVDPDELHKNPAFTNVVVVEGPVRTVHVGGQNAVDASGDIVGKGEGLQVGSPKQIGSMRGFWRDSLRLYDQLLSLFRRKRSALCRGYSLGAGSWSAC